MDDFIDGDQTFACKTCDEDVFCVFLNHKTLSAS